jgi:hypothetical protein
VGGEEIKMVSAGLQYVGIIALDYFRNTNSPDRTRQIKADRF